MQRQITSPPPPPNSGKFKTFFGCQKQRLAHITEPSNDDYDNDVSDHNFGTFDDFGVKNYQKVSHIMVLMSKYKGQHGGKKGQKIRAGVSPPLFRAMPERIFFSGGLPLSGADPCAFISQNNKLGKLRRHPSRESFGSKKFGPN